MLCYEKKLKEIATQWRNNSNEQDDENRNMKQEGVKENDNNVIKDRGKSEGRSIGNKFQFTLVTQVLSLMLSHVLHAVLCYSVVRLYCFL